jgi:hypothetical protein
MSKPIRLSNGLSAHLHQSGDSLYLRDTRGNLNYIGEAEKGVAYALVKGEDGTLYVEYPEGQAYHSQNGGVLWHPTFND